MVSRLTDYRSIDHFALALERGIRNAVDKIEHQSTIALGPIVEAVSLAWTSREIAPFILKFDCQKLIQTIRTARKQPLKARYGREGDRQWGFICFNESTAEVVREPLQGFQLATRKAMLLPTSANQAKARICGALQELVDNILDHSGAPRTGIAGFLVSAQHFELSVGDAGMGMLASLRSNPTFSYLTDAGSAMAVGLEEGNSRYGLQDRGFGFGTLFRALNTLNAELRFRTGDYALEVAGRSPTLRNNRISQKAVLQGFVASVKLTL